MRRNNFFKKINRNNDTGFCHHINRTSRFNIDSPDIFLSEFSFDEPNIHNGVKIIELGSAAVSPSSPEVPFDSSHARSYINDADLRKLEEYFRINKNVREKGHCNEKSYTFNDILTDESTDVYERVVDENAEEFPNNAIKLNYQKNCFKIINEHFFASDTSSENDCAEIRPSDFPELSDWTDDYVDEIIAIADTEHKNQTLWIYSFKNKHLLANDFELDISDKDTSSSSVEDTDASIKDTNKGRVGSPTPPSYIPRLNLYPTLSTVTEISEPVKHTSSNDTPRTDELPSEIRQSDLVDKDNAKSDLNKFESNNILKCRALSPGQKHRCFSAGASVIVEGPTLPWNSTSKSKFKNTTSNNIIRSIRDSQVQTDISVDPHETTNITKFLRPVVLNFNVDEMHSARDEVFVDQITKDKSKNINAHTKISPINLEDTSELKINCNRNNWISDNLFESETNAFDYGDHVVPSDKINLSIADNRLQNGTLLKPVTPRLPRILISETVPSFLLTDRLSLSTSRNESWWRRLIHKFKCCK